MKAMLSFLQMKRAHGKLVYCELVTDVTQSISKSQNQLQGLFLRKDKAQPKRDRACVLLIFGSLVRNISE